MLPYSPLFDQSTMSLLIEHEETVQWGYRLFRRRRYLKVGEHLREVSIPQSG